MRRVPRLPQTSPNTKSDIQHISLLPFNLSCKKTLDNIIKRLILKGYEDEQYKLKQTVAEITTFIDTNEQKKADIDMFLNIVRNRTRVMELTPVVVHEFIEKIVIYAPDKSSGHRRQRIDIVYRFKVATATVIADRWEYSKNRKAA